jgi:tetratricopeptide (TPR) repeat protein
LDELAIDIFFLIQEIKKQKFWNDTLEMILVGYSEGSIVATKVLGLLKIQPNACILLGSASGQVNYKTAGWEDWHMVEALRKVKGWSDDHIRAEYEKLRSFHAELLSIDESRFEMEWKNQKKSALAPWESYYINKEIPFYDCIPNLLSANIPILICIGENDLAMPMLAAKRTYDALVENKYDKATFRLIDNEGHTYDKYDIYSIIDTWLHSEGKSTKVTLKPEDRLIISRYALSDSIRLLIRSLPWHGESETAIEFFQLAEENAFEHSHSWFKLGMVLFDNKLYAQSYVAFQKSITADNPARFASMVWIGHIHDLNSEREKAIQWYLRALEIYPGFPVQHDHYQIKIDSDWIQDRLDSPFESLK